MTGAAAIVADIIQVAGLGTLGADLFIGFEPNKPTGCITCIDTGGVAPTYLTVGAMREQAVQVRVRGDDPVAVHDTIEAVISAVGRHDGFDVDDGTRVSGIWQRSEPFTDGRDERGRVWHTVNFLVRREV